MTMFVCNECEDGWHVATLVVTDLATLTEYTFNVDDWLEAPDHRLHVLTPGKELAYAPIDGIFHSNIPFAVTCHQIPRLTLQIEDSVQCEMGL